MTAEWHIRAVIQNLHDLGEQERRWHEALIMVLDECIERLELVKRIAEGKQNEDDEA